MARVCWLRKDEQVGPAQVNQYELTYINHIFETNAPFLRLFKITWVVLMEERTHPELSSCPRFANVRLQFAFQTVEARCMSH